MKLSASDLMRSGFRAMLSHKQYTALFLAFTVLTYSGSAMYLGSQPGDWGSGSFLFFAFSLLFQAWFYFGLVRVGVAVGRGQTPTWSLFRFTHIIEMSVVGTVAMIAMGLGMLLLIIPGFYLMLAWCLFWLLILDGRAHWFGSLSTSRQLMAGHKMVLIRFFLIVIVASIPVYIVQMLPYILSDVPFPPKDPKALANVQLPTWATITNILASIAGATIYLSYNLGFGIFYARITTPTATPDLATVDVSDLDLPYNPLPPPSHQPPSSSN